MREKQRRAVIRLLSLLTPLHSLLSFSLWTHAPLPGERPDVIDLAWLRANPVSPASQRLSRDLKKRGWTFVGPTTVYAFMQAMGLVNDHLDGCYCRPLALARRG